MFQDLVLACFLVAGFAKKDPVCGRTWKKVNKWRKHLQEVGTLGTGASELLFEEPVEALWEGQVNVLADTDYDHLRMKYKEPHSLRQPRWSRGVYTKQLVKIRNGYLFPSGFIANATHRFDLGVLNNINCVQSQLARKVGRRNCYKTDWSSAIIPKRADEIPDPHDSSWLTDGLKQFSYICKEISSAISLIDTRYADYGHFHESILPRLLWPVVQQLRDIVVIWRLKEEAFIKPWLKLLGLSPRQFESIRYTEMVFKFDVLYVPIYTGINLELADYSELVLHTPPSDIQLIRGVALEHLPAEDGGPVVLLLERDPKLRRGLSPEDTVQLRQAALSLAKAAGCPLVHIRGRDGGFELGKKVKATKLQISWQPLSLSKGLLLFRRAKAALGVHGALFMHLVVAPAGAHVIEIQTMHTYDIAFYNLCSVLGLHYWYHPGDGTHSAPRMQLNAARLHKLIDKVTLAMTSGNLRTQDEL